jgi:tetratricopeptide (TPR) repeat protein
MKKVVLLIMVIELLTGCASPGGGGYDKAIAEYTKAIKLDPNDAGAYFNRGIAYGYKGDYDQAIADFEATL